MTYKTYQPPTQLITYIKLGLPIDFAGQLSFLQKANNKQKC